MAAVKLYNLARMLPASAPGTGTISLGSAVSGFLTFALAGVSNGEIVRYAINDGANSEIGYGTYTSAGTTLSRTPEKSTNGDAAIDVSATAQIFITPSKRDYPWVVDSGNLIASIGLNGATNPALQVDYSTVSAATGWKASALAAGAGALLAVISSGTDEPGFIDAKGAGALSLQSTGTGPLVVNHTASLSIGGNADKQQQYGTTAATGGMTLGMFNATAGTAAHFDFYRSKNASIGSATVVASGDGLGSINWYGAQQTGTFATQTMAAQMRVEVDGTVTSGASGDMPGRIVWATTADGGAAVTDRMILDCAGALKPATNDGLALGNTSLMFADLFLASGGVINWNNGDVTATHASNTLTFGGASSGYQFDALAAPSSSDGAALGSTSLMWSDLFLASGAVVNFNNGNVTATHSTNTLTIGGGTLSSLVVALSGTTVSNSSTTGALVVSGGIGVAKDITLSDTSLLRVGDVELRSYYGSFNFNAYNDGAWKYRNAGTAYLFEQNNRASFIFQTAASGSANGAITWASALTLFETGGINLAAPTGGDKGFGTLNAKAVYDDNTLLTDYVFDKFLKLDKGKGYSERVQPLFDALDPGMFGIDAYIDYWRKNQRLYGMPDLNDCIDGIVKDVSLGGQIQRLTQTAELHAIHMASLNERLVALESPIH